MPSPSPSPSSPAHTQTQIRTQAQAQHSDSTATTLSHVTPGQVTSVSNVTVYPTSGPDAYTSPIMATGRAGPPALNPRSCVTCRRRKVRCDKQMPCSNCRRARIPCAFPAPGRAPRQPRPKDPSAPSKSSSHREAELIKRLKKLEGIVEELSGQIEEPGAAGASGAPGGATEVKLLSSTASPEPVYPGADSLPLRQSSTGNSEDFATCDASSRAASSVGGSSDGVKAKQNFGRMVADEGRRTSRYISSGFWSELNDALDAIREETQRLTDEDDVDSDCEETPEDSPRTVFGNISDHHAFILGYRSADVDLQDLHPLPAQSSLLWSIYIENVEPLVKIMHVPSVDLIMCDARDNFDKLTPGNKALVFVIYLAAVTSLEPDEVQTYFGANKNDLLAQFRFAVEQALAKAKLLDTSDLVVLRAFTLFLVVVKRHEDSRFCWALTGLAVRIAQGMGLHRDGSHLKLSPFEAEMRRRLWWAILILDLRSADELGTDMTISETSYDTLMPANINDSDIGPESTEAPMPREGKSDCAVMIVRCEICALARKILTAGSAMTSLCPSSEISSIADREHMITEVYRRVEQKFFQHVLDETDTLYWTAAMIARILVGKMCLVIYQPMLFPGSEYELSDDIRQRVYISAIEVIEYTHRLNVDLRCKQYSWLFKTYAIWHAVAYTLIETCRRPWTALVERGWDAVTGSDIDPLELAKMVDHAAVFLPLQKLFTKAREHRESEIGRLRRNQDEARRLDFAERLNPAQARFGPIPGAENRTELMREKWWSLIRPQEASSKPYLAHPSTVSWGQSSTSQPGSDTVHNSNGNISTEINMSSALMEYMDGIMAQPNPAIAELWHLNQLNEGNLVTETPTLAAPPLTSQDLASDQNAMNEHRPDPLHTEASGDGSLPTYLWSDAFTPVNVGPSGDTDMLGDDFDWHDWSQSIRGLETGSSQIRPAWY
ncbi:hypothetical protein E4U10_004922 [Claviceps purpurea]|nr:hypothetical protein E4U36_007217 [Claviceps purpurea]KAG6199402.1 hypothetical protein E4U10_004922 [Claviceps purpurea]KAG6317124.1 hypothetical protein E4U44_000263 [Claviceps purpurea]